MFFTRSRRIAVQGSASGSATTDTLRVVTFNVWFDAYFAEQRYAAIADLVERERPDVVALQEITAPALETLLTQPWVRSDYVHAAAVGGGLGNYGMVLLSRLPLTRVTYTRLPTRQQRGVLRADLVVNGRPQTICSIHLDSGKVSVAMRARQLRRIFRSLARVDDAILLGDFNMRDAENPNIVAPYRDVWPLLRPDDPGFTEDTAINLTRLDARNKARQVRFDRVLVKGDAWTPETIDLLGTEPISPAHPRVFPSDHFGVACQLVSRPADQLP